MFSCIEHCIFFFKLEMIHLSAYESLYVLIFVIGLKQTYWWSRLIFVPQQQTQCINKLLDDLDYNMCIDSETQCILTKLVTNGTWQLQFLKYEKEPITKSCYSLKAHSCSSLYSKYIWYISVQDSKYTWFYHQWKVILYLGKGQNA